MKRPNVQCRNMTPMPQPRCPIHNQGFKQILVNLKKYLNLLVRLMSYSRRLSGRHSLFMKPRLSRLSSIKSQIGSA